MNTEKTIDFCSQTVLNSQSLFGRPVVAGIQCICLKWKWKESGWNQQVQAIILVIKKRRDLRQFMKEVWAGGGMWQTYICLNADRKETMETEIDIGMDGCSTLGRSTSLKIGIPFKWRDLISDGEGPCSYGIRVTEAFRDS